ncbi:hypothetical protein [Nocardia sp. BMG51109]|uniref:hypothetical protein n=1 Tax=Nocardia sp. BMG51109 TaxID=1056816 RepID=UPI0004B77263|nr:hypothetical protein [Nocardia sp. BMG51109]
MALGLAAAAIALITGAGAGGYVMADSGSSGDTPAERPTARSRAALTIGLRPDAVDYRKNPGFDEATLMKRIEAAQAAIRDAGFDAVPCAVSAIPDEAERQLRECMAGRPFGVAMIGGGVRLAAEHTVLLERIVNTLNDTTPGITFCFNTGPETSIDALRRAARR